MLALDTLAPGRGMVTIELLGRGDLVGLSWSQLPYQWQFGAITTQPLQAFGFDTAQVRTARGADPAFGYALMSLVLTVALAGCR
jgi:hypothetical protein